MFRFLCLSLIFYSIISTTNLFATDAKTNTYPHPKKTALIIVDIQNSFCPGGELPVTDGDKVVPIVNNLRDLFPTVVLSQDYHPRGHSSFASSHEGKAFFETDEEGNVLWPDHCVQGSPGAEFHKDLVRKEGDLVIKKGTNPKVDSYSAFYENDKKTPPRFDDGKTLTEVLRERGITTLVLGGLAYDFCVGWTAEDAVKDGFKVIVVKDATRSIAMPLPGGKTTETVMDERLAAAGVEVITAEELKARFAASAG